MNKIRIYTVEGCPYCEDFKSMLDIKGYEYEVIDVDLPENQDEFEQVMEKTGNDLVPTVLFKDMLLAPDVNYDHLSELMDIIEDLYKS